MQDLQWLNGSAMPVLDTIHKIYRNTASQPTHVTVTEGTLHTALLISQENRPPAIQDYNTVHINYTNCDCTWLSGYKTVTYHNGTLNVAACWQH